MTRYVRMSTPSRSASARASALGRTLKPTTSASDADARLMSFSVIAADARVDDVHAHLGVLDLLELAEERLDGALHVALQHDVQLLDLARLEVVVQRLEGDAAPRPLRELLAAQPLRAHVREVLRLALVLDDPDELTGGRRLVEAEDLDRLARPGLASPSRRDSRRARAPCRTRRLPRRRRRRAACRGARARSRPARDRRPAATR